MKRSDALVPLSHEHHQALFIAQRLRRGSGVEGPAAEFRHFWREHGAPHFRAEEEILLPMWQMLGRPVGEHVDRVAREHLLIRALALAIERGSATREDLVGLGELVQAHVRFEERELFPLIESDLDAAARAQVGAALRAVEA